MLTCYVIGTGTLLEEALVQLAHFHFQIFGVFSDDVKVRAYCHENGIRIYSMQQVEQIKSNPCNYLFSIVNPLILSEDILSCVKKLAINYHDSLLPRYAGVNASAWAILNGEKEHGITWHQMNSGIDCGDIILQKAFFVDENETTFSLNLRCYEAALESLPELLSQITENTIRLFAQDNSKRSFYRYQDKPRGDGFIDRRLTTAEIDRLLRALDFGRSKNTLAQPKIIIEDKIYILQAYEKGYGFPVRRNDSFVIDTQDGFIRVFELRDLSNRAIQGEDLGNMVALPPATYETILECILAAAKRNPHKKIIFEGHETFSYHDVLSLSNKLATKIKPFASRQKAILVHCLKGSNYLIALVACLRLGCLYVPIDPNYPELRKKVIYEDCEAIGVITDVPFEIADLPPEFIVHINPLELSNDLEGEELNEEQPNDFLYMMYTSGSTGKPKGALVKNTSFINLMNWYLPLCLGQNEKTYILTSLSFDLTQKNMIGGLCAGTEVHFRENNGIYDSHDILDYIAINQITHINCPTSAFLSVIEGPKAPEKCQSLRHLVLGANLFRGGVLKELIRVNPELKIYNSYGPAECTDVCACYTLNAQDIEENKVVPIGGPIPGVEIFIMDDDKKVLPVGVTGELCVTGIAVSNGYFNRVEATEKVFLDNTIPSSRYAGKIYRTGDRAFLREDGNLMFVNRTDDQIKIRGFRVELGEIENCLNSMRGIVSSCVLVREYLENKSIIAFVVSECAVNDIFIFLKKYLPEYMLPHEIYKINRMPLTLHGKINRIELLGAIPSLQSSQADVVSPLLGLEKRLSDLWAQILRRDISTNQLDFFSVGGDSLLAIKLVGAIEKEFGIRLRIIDIYQHSNLAAMAILIEKSRNSKDCISYTGKEAVSSTDTNFVSEQQRSVLLVHKTHPELASLYNTSYCFSIQGELNLDCLSAALNHLYQCFPILRNNFEIDSDFTIRRSISKADLNVRITQSHDENVRHHLKNIRLDLSTDSLFLVDVFVCPHSYVLVMHGHHSVMDAESVTIMCEFLSKTYSAFLNNLSLPSPKDCLDYDHYVVWQKQYRETSEYQEKLAEYVNGMSNYRPAKLPYDASPTQAFELASECVFFELDNPEEYAAISRFCQTHRVSFFSFLWAVVSLQIQAYTGEKEIFAGNYVANRYPAQFDKTIGFFANLFIIKASWGLGESFIDFVKRIHSELVTNIELHHVPARAMFKSLKVNNQSNITNLVPFGIEYINSAQLTNLILGDCKVKPIVLDYKNGKFNLAFRFFHFDTEKISAAIEYNTVLFQKESIDRMIRDFKSLLSTLLARAEEPIVLKKKASEGGPIADQIFKIWQSALGWDEIDYDKDFFALGGESLLAIEILRLVKKECDIEVDIQDFFEFPTIRSFADFIQKKRQPSSTALNFHSANPVVKFREHANPKKILFAVHPLSNNASVYRYFSEHLDSDIACYAIESHNYYHQHKISDVRVLATLYNHQLKKQQKKGPYYLMGWSYGGMLAYEMARQLIAQGEEVAGLYLLDSFLLTPPLKKSFAQLFDYFGRLRQEIFSINPQDSAEIAHFDELLTTELSMMVDYEYEAYPNRAILFKAREAFSHTAHIHVHEMSAFMDFQTYLLNNPTSGYQGIIPQLAVETVDSNHHHLLNDPVCRRIAYAISTDMLRKITYGSFRA